MSSFINMQIVRFNKYLCNVRQKRENCKLQPFISDTKPVTVWQLICLFCCALYNYLLNLKICMLIDDDMNYPLIFFIKFFINF
jgi:hypothetical protein